MSSEGKDQKEENVTSEVDNINIPDIGEVEVKVINREGKGGNAFAVHGMSKFVRNEWVHVGNHLAQKFDLAVYVPNLHSNENTEPDNKDSITALEYIVQKHYKLNNVLLCAKSWGTEAVAQMAVTGTSVHSIIFANPINRDFLDSIHNKKFPLMYLTNEDDFAKEDTMELYENEWKDDPNFVSFVGPSSSPALIKPAKLGGHLMTQAFLEPIHEFVEKFYLGQSKECDMKELETTAASRRCRIL